MMPNKALLLICVLAASAACGGSGEQGGSFQTVGRQPDVAPVMLNKELPFRYPPALFAQKVQGNVTLRIYIDRNGQIVPDSTHVAETSGFSALDSAAVKGSRELKFEPAKTGGQAVPVSILLPVFFRYPGAAPLPGDSILQRTQSVSSTASAVSQKPPPSVDTPKKAAAAPAKKPVKKTVKSTKKKRRR
ncbi:MAG: energy transducer TonB [Gemmatimonadota bacterium]|nr:energy transducer TonB [Gemmatimonadota bacterium]